MKYQTIPTQNLGSSARYLLQIIQGIFKLNGELCFIPHVTMEDKKHPFKISNWPTGLWTHQLADLRGNMISLFAHPICPTTYRRTRQKNMDKGLVIFAETIVRKKGNTIILNTRGHINTLTFVRKLSDKERLSIFNGTDPYEGDLRYFIWQASQSRNVLIYEGIHRDEWVDRYLEYKKQQIFSY